MKIHHDKIKRIVFLLLILCLFIYLGHYFNDFRRVDNDVVSQKETKVDESANKLKKVSQINKEAKLWLEIEGIALSEVLVQGADNEFYLTHNNQKKVDKNGALFIDYEVPIIENKLPDNLIVYGHNMENHQAFSDLWLFGSKDFLLNSKEIVLTDQFGIKYYFEPFLFARVNAAEKNFFPYHTWIYWDEIDNARAYYEGMKKYSLAEKEVDLSTTDKLLTLSTCDNAYDDARYVLLAKEIIKIK